MPQSPVPAPSSSAHPPPVDKEAIPPTPVSAPAESEEGVQANPPLPPSDPEAGTPPPPPESDLKATDEIMEEVPPLVPQAGTTVEEDMIDVEPA